MTGNTENVFGRPKTLQLDVLVEAVEIDFSKPRTIRIIAVNSKGPNKEYLLKITSKGGATLV